MKKIILLLFIITNSNYVMATEENCNKFNKLTKAYTGCLAGKLKTKGSETSEKIKQKSSKTSERLKENSNKAKSTAKKALQKVTKFLKKD